MLIKSRFAPGYTFRAQTSVASLGSSAFGKSSIDSFQIRFEPQREQRPIVNSYTTGNKQLNNALV